MKNQLKALFHDLGFDVVMTGHNSFGVAEAHAENEDFAVWAWATATRITAEIQANGVRVAEFRFAAHKPPALYFHELTPALYQLARDFAEAAGQELRTN